MFAYRIDTDGASWEDIDTLRAISTASGLPYSWFLDVESHEGWLSWFTGFDVQEIGVHCYVHRVFGTYEENYRNLRTAIDALATVGIRPRGFSAPFGIWTPGLRQAVRDLRFEYSSEFSFAYVTFPIMDSSAAGVSQVMQVPIHPICPGQPRCR